MPYGWLHMRIEQIGVTLESINLDCRYTNETQGILIRDVSYKSWRERESSKNLVDMDYF